MNAASQSILGSLPLVSVMIPAYNAEATIALTLDSVIGQTYRPIEVVVVNDGSTDSTASIIEHFIQNRVDGAEIVVKTITTENGGLIAARRKGLQLSTGELLQFLDADDVLHSKKIEISVDALLEANSDVAVSATEHFEDENEIKLRITTAPEKRKWKKRVIQTTSLTSNLWYTAGPLFTRSIVERAGGFPNDVNAVIEELEFHGRIKLKNPKVVYIDCLLNFYRKGQTSAVTAQALQVYEGRIEGAKIIRTMLVSENNGSNLEWISLSLMALKTCYQISVAKPNEKDLYARSIAEFRNILRAWSPLTSVAAAFPPVFVRAFLYLLRVLPFSTPKSLRKAHVGS